MKKNKIWKILATAGSLVALGSCQAVIRPYAGTATGSTEYVVSGAKQCRRLLMEIASSTEKGARQECFVTGKDYRPESLVIAQMFPDAINISNTKISEYREGGHDYVTCRIGFERRGDEREKKNEVQQEDPNGRHWYAGDLRSMELGNETYMFRCIDEDYEYNSEYQTCALFLCETVIRSDVDSTESKREILTFGGTNNYKTSDIRKWLKSNLKDPGNHLLSVNTGVSSAYLGATAPGTYEEFSVSSLFRQELYDQMEEDKIFLLSLEEAIRYRDELWDIDGGNTPYSHGYWLRTPTYSAEEDGTFCYGNRVYAVDLAKGCIRPAQVSDGSIGIRPAFCLPQV